MASNSPKGDNVGDVEVDARRTDDVKRGDNSGDGQVTPIQQTQSSILNIPVPTVDFELNVFLDDIAEEVTEDELKRMKRMLQGQPGTKKRALETIKTPSDLFEHLQNLGMLDKNNVLYIQSLLWHVGRKDLHKKLVEFAKDFSQKPLYFYAPREIPVNGYKYLNFHVAGVLESITREEVEHLRSLISRLQCVPIEFVTLAGIEPLNSVVITFMVPEDVVDIMLQLSGVEKSLLQNMRIDFFRIGDKKVMISGRTFEKPVALTEESEVKKILKKNGKLEDDLDKSQANLLQKGKELKTSLKNFSASQRKVSELKKQIHILENKYETEKQKKNDALTILCASVYSQSQHRPQSQIDTLQKSSALSYFRFCFKKFRDEYPYSSEVIEHLLEANTLLARLEEQNVWKSFTETLANRYSFLEQEFYKLQYFHSGVKEAGIQERLMLRLSRSAEQRAKEIKLSQWHRQSSSMRAEKIPQQENVHRKLFDRRQNVGSKPEAAEEMKVAPSPTTPYNEPFAAALREISKMLTNAQKEKLLENVSLNKIQRYEFDKQSDKFLKLLLDTEKKSYILSPSAVVVEKLQQLKDADLVQKAEHVFELASQKQAADSKSSDKKMLMKSAMYSKKGFPDWVQEGLKLSKDDVPDTEQSSSKQDPPLQSEEERMAREDARDRQMEDLMSVVRTMEDKLNAVYSLMCFSPTIAHSPDLQGVATGGKFDLKFPGRASPIYNL